MVRAGRPSERAAMIYQHSNLERQREVAAGIDARVQACTPRHLARIWHVRGREV